MSIDNIEKKSILYASLKYYLSKAFRVYYKFSFNDKSGIIEGDPVIYAPNHQNALIDPLAVAFTRKSQTSFLARSDIFKNKHIANFLYSIKMLPVFRIRDGFENVRKNQEIFDRTMKVIANGNGLVIFPEANHAGYKKLRAFKKGISRIAFQTELNYNEELNVKIVPVGIEYEHYYWLRSKIHINFGKAILVKDYIEEYKINKPQGLNSLNNAIKEAIKPLIVNIPLNDEEYDAVNYLTEINYNNTNTRGSISYENKIKLDQRLVEDILRYKESEVDNYEILVRKTLEYKNMVDNKSTNDYSVNVIGDNKSYWYIYLTLIFIFPLYLIGLLFNYIPYKIPYFTTRKIQDVQFHSTLYYAIGSLAVFPIIYTIYLLLLNNFLNISLSLVFLICTGFLGILSYEYWRLFIKLKKILRVSSSNSVNKEILSNRSDISKIINSISQ